MPPKGTKAGAKNYGAAKEARREARYAAKEGGTTIFNNAQGLLPAAGKNQHYTETDVGAGRQDRGKRRVVSLVETSTGRVFRQYHTDDHYSSFVQQ